MTKLRVAFHNFANAPKTSFPLTSIFPVISATGTAIQLLSRLHSSSLSNRVSTPDMGKHIFSSLNRPDQLFVRSLTVKTYGTSALNTNTCLCVVRHHAMKTWKSGGTGTQILNRSIRWRQVDSFTFRPPNFRKTATDPTE
jgi:hypothetical protein